MKLASTVGQASDQIRWNVYYSSQLQPTVDAVEKVQFIREVEQDIRDGNISVSEGRELIRKKSRGEI